MELQLLFYIRLFKHLLMDINDALTEEVDVSTLINLPDLFKEEIKKKGLKQNFISTQIGIHHTYLSSMLNGDKVLSNPVRSKLNSLLGTNF